MRILSPPMAERRAYNVRTSSLGTVIGITLTLFMLGLLAACDHLVGDTTSSFAQVAWLLSNRGGESLHDVRRTASLERRLRGIVRSCLPGGREPCAPW